MRLFSRLLIAALALAPLSGVSAAELTAEQRASMSQAIAHCISTTIGMQSVAKAKGETIDVASVEKAIAGYWTLLTVLVGKDQVRQVADKAVEEDINVLQNEGAGAFVKLALNAQVECVRIAKENGPELKQLIQAYFAQNAETPDAR